MSNSFYGTYDKFNELITRASESIACDADCQKNKGMQQLAKEYEKSKINLITAPEKVDIAFKNLYEYKYGELAYNEEHAKKLKTEAEIIINKTSEKFKGSIADIMSLLKTYESLLKTHGYVYDYDDKLQKENAVLKKKLKEKGEGIVTNDRKTYYEDHGIDQLNFFYTIFRIIYVILLISFAICIFAVPSDTIKPILLVALVILIAYPFFSTPLFLGLMKMYNKALTVLPKNAYKTL
jgi:hypothetical protein